VPIMLSLTGSVPSKSGLYAHGRVRFVGLVGPAERTSRIAKQVSAKANARIRFEIISDLADSSDVAAKAVRGADIDKLIGLVRQGRISRILLATSPEECERTAAIMERLEGLAVDVDYVLDELSIFPAIRNGPPEGVCTARIMNRPLSPAQAIVKSVMDKVGAALLLFFTGPLMLCVALAVKVTSSGSVFFRQQRFGVNNEVFEVFRFRTLYHHQADLNARQPVKRHDARVTPIGKVLRSLSLDELPQLLNVLKGDMSLVGPRSLPLGLKVEGKLCSDFPRYAARHRMRPGITGLAQIRGWRGGMDTAEELAKRLEYDLAYIDEYSLILDVRILLATTLVVLRPTNAY
jgi:exopolysaccharide biosynthesis polyprenyl glycosylphosphotransferase